MGKEEGSRECEEWKEGKLGVGNENLGLSKINRIYIYHLNQFTLDSGHA